VKSFCGFYLRHFPLHCMDGEDVESPFHSLVSPFHRYSFCQRYGTEVLRCEVFHVLQADAAIGLITLVVFSDPSFIFFFFEQTP